jgi:NADPH:quinone reductase-like Zn-dependent oxidoreductase
MKAFAIEELGKPGSVQELAVPEPGEGQLRIKVAAAGVNPEITSPEIHSFPFVDAGKAFEEVATGHVRGKVVITMV